MSETIKRIALRIAAMLAILWTMLLLSVVTACGQTASIPEILNRLQSIRADELATTVPPAARPLLVQLKHQLRDLIHEELNKRAGRKVSAGTLQAKVLARLKSMGVKLGITKTDVFDQPGYGEIESINIQRPPKHSDLLAVTTTVSIFCGLDSSLYLFQRKGARWRLLLADEANNYKDISGGQGLFGYAVAPPDRQGKFFVVAVNVNPWCSSNWQGIRYKVLRPSINAEQPKVVMSREEGIYLGVERRYSLNIKSGGFTLTFTGMQNLDAAIVTRLYIENFLVAGNRADRIAPVSLKPEDFLDEWIHLPWSEAARWTVPTARSSLKLWHERLQKLEEGYSSELLFVQPCRSRRREWQIGVFKGSRDSSEPPSLKLFFTIVRQRQTFFLRYVGTKRPAGCPGETSPYGS